MPDKATSQPQRQLDFRMRFVRELTTHNKRQQQQVDASIPVRDAGISLCTDSKVRKKKQRLKFCTLPELFNGHAGSTAGPTGTTACCGQRVQ